MRRLVGLLLLCASPALADSHAVTVRNGGSETIRAIQIGPEGRLGENRMRSQLPPGAEARITYSTGCPAMLRLTYANGQTEDHTGLDVCTDPRVVAGQSGVAGPAVAAPPPNGAAATSAATATAAPAAGSAPPPRTSATPVAVTGKPGPVPQINKTPVPPWTGHSLIRRFGGMD